MRIISSFMEDLVITEYECHSVYFESSKMQMKFRKLIKDYFNNKKMEDFNYIDVVDGENQSISPRNFYFIDFDCFSIDLKSEKGTTKLLLDLLKYELEHNLELLDGYREYLTLTDRFISQLELGEEALKVDFQITEKTIEAMLKSLHVTIEYDEDQLVLNHHMREFLIKAMLRLNLTEKEVVLLLSFPEVDIGFQDYEKMVKFIEGLGITVIILSANPYFITYPSAERIFLMNKNGGRYNIPMLAKELAVFNLVNDDNAEETAKKLAYRDFTADYILLCPVLKKFLQSDGEYF